MSLTVADLKDVYVATFHARNKWRNILLHLEVPPTTINSIGVAWGNNPDDCYREGLSEWLTSGNRSWKDVVDALSSPIVDHSDIAKTIEQGHIHSSETPAKTSGKL